MHFLWLEALTMSINNPTNIFLISPNIILDHIFSLIFMNINIIIINRKFIDMSIRSCFHIISYETFQLETLLAQNLSL